jgi:ABC-type transport system involved in multi-copper enzyme maturation permease subunit
MVNFSVAWHTFHQHHWFRISIMALVVLFVFLSADATGHNQFIYLTPFLVWVMGSGIVGRDMSSGVAHLLFTRPITRFSYILTKWASLVTSVFLFQCALFVFWVLGKMLFHHNPELSSDLLFEFGLSTWITMTLSAVVVCFSTIMPGWGDLALLLYCHVILLVLNISTLRDYIPDFNHVIEGLLRLIWPGAMIGYSYATSREYIGGFHSSLTLGDFAIDTAIAIGYFLAAVYLMKRKDISYTSD